MTLDESLLTVLHDNGRLSISEIARRLGVPRHRVEERMRTLTHSQMLRFVANVHPSLLGIHHYCHVLLWVDGPAGPVAKRLSEMPNVPLVSAVTGDHDLVIEIGARDQSNLEEVLTEIRTIPGVRATRASQHTRSFVSRFGADADLAATSFPPLDSVDLQLVELLRNDGRLPYQTLSESVGLSIGAVRARVNKLIDSGMLRITALTNMVERTRNFMIGIGITSRGSTAPISEALRRMPATEYGALTIGHFDLIATLSSGSMRSLQAALDTLCELPEVDHVSSWMHLNVERESYEI